MNTDLTFTHKFCRFTIYYPLRGDLGSCMENIAKRTKISEYEKQIDQLVYKLYGLAKEEIEIVERGK